MILDSGTLNDLDVVSTPMSGGPTLLGLVDRTRTHIGREHLRQCLTAPPHVTEAILARQQAHRALALRLGMILLKQEQVLDLLDRR